MNDTNSPVRSTGLICVSVSGADLATDRGVVHQLPEPPDVIEVRLDALRRAELCPCSEIFSGPVLCTHRPHWEGGRSYQNDAERAAFLRDALDNGAAFIDWELEADIRQRCLLLERMASGDAKMIISNHNFQETPSVQHLQIILQRMATSGAHIGKIVTMARCPADVLRVLALLETAAELHFPLCSFCMGAQGVISRLATLYLGGFMSYAAADNVSATAPGQISFAALLAARRSLAATGGTVL